LSGNSFGYNVKNAIGKYDGNNSNELVLGIEPLVLVDIPKHAQSYDGNIDFSKSSIDSKN
jgi:hypothetical protein